MNTAGLSLDNIPEFRIPMGFFLTAPWFGILASLLLLFSPEVINSRWHPAMLATVHLLTLGFAASIMIGAMMQVLPVIGSQPVPAVARLSPWIRGALVGGTASLALGFLLMQNILFYLALVLLCGVFLTFLSAVGLALVKVQKPGDSIYCLRLAALCLLLTVVFGVLQLSTYLDFQWLAYSFERTDKHALLGLVGWCLLLVMGVSFQVIPMFHVAPAFPKWFCRGVTTLLVLLLAMGVFLSDPFATIALVLLPLVVGFYGCYSLYILHNRKRKLTDYTVRCWQLSFVNLVAACLLYILGQLGIEILDRRDQFHLLLGFGFGLGFVITVMLGMLQKIVPFLMFLHLQRACIHDPSAFIKLPNMRELLPVSDSKWQFRLHSATLLTFYLSFFGGNLQYPLVFVAAAFMLASFSWLFATLYRANNRYTRNLPRQKPQQPADSAL
ncbi:hypothetical protein [Motiliproteus sp. MSK22-1]|uniref:hypothetical protein n=1 Tax=Motiliproteus sp. MSK22-1 TaxID=1897630 RepID=UPI0009768E33|nr:hypothetical protein [Motiliproteus sp. MSK22-1]OMH32759.1 hypothetical protein BGP75_14635 [Motiliproteus sp. MSK22-1]